MNSSNQVQKYQELAKRMRLKYSLDRLLAALVLLLCSPVYILIAIIIKFDGLLHPAHRGPIFYTETRVSAGKEFEIIKFRTVPMSVIKEIRSNAGRSSITGQAQTTCAGKWILKWYLDELGQILNILKGDMSFVGPRPHIVAQHNDEIRMGWHYRNCIKAGLLGVPQACKHNPKYMEALTKMKYSHESGQKFMGALDSIYAKECLKKSIFEIILFDFCLIIKGLWVVVRGEVKS